MANSKVRKLLVRGDYQVLEIDAYKEEYLFTLAGWVEGCGEGSETHVDLEIETGWVDQSCGLPVVRPAEFDGKNLFDIAYQIMEWTEEVRRQDLEFEAIASMFDAEEEES